MLFPGSNPGEFICPFKKYINYFYHVFHFLYSGEFLFIFNQLIILKLFLDINYITLFFRGSNNSTRHSGLNSIFLDKK
jgi:hypothetical protein